MSGEALQAIQDRLTAFQAAGDTGVLMDPRALDEVAAARSAIGWPAFGALPDDSDIRPNVNTIAVIGTFIWLRAQRLPDADQLDARLEATELLAAAYAVAPGSVPRKLARTVAALSGGGRSRHHADMHDHAVDVLAAATRDGDLAGVDNAIILMTAAIRAAGRDPYRPYYLSDLGSAWLGRFRITGRPRDLDNAVATHYQALATPVNVPEDQAGRLASYSAALLARFERAASLRDLDGAIAAARAAASLADAAAGATAAGYLAAPHATEAPLFPGARQSPPPPRAPEAPARQPAAFPVPRSPDADLTIRLARLASLTRLSAALLASFRLRHDRADINAAVQASRTAVGLAAPGDPVHERSQAALASALRERYGAFEDEADLAGAQAAEQAAAAVRRQASPGPDRPDGPDLPNRPDRPDGPDHPDRPDGPDSPGRPPRRSAPGPFRRRR
jgi:hypothetical protein